MHDLDAHRDLVFALVGDERRREMIRRPTSVLAEARRAEVFDLSGVARDHVADAVAAALTMPLATEWHSVTFAADGYWRGETHRLCDRPAGLIRLHRRADRSRRRAGPARVGGAGAAGPARAAAATHRRPRTARRIPAVVRSGDGARRHHHAPAGVRIFTVRPAHNPVGPFDFAGGFDERSERRQRLAELMTRGYEDAYHQFIEPVVGASGERVGHLDRRASL